jgi:serine/threonine protein kinase
VDFGLSAIVFADKCLTEQLGTFAFFSPEVVQGLPYSQKTDVWSLGVVLYILLTNHMPFLEQDKERTKFNIINQEINFAKSCWFYISP